MEYPGAYYHVINRGNAVENIFIDERDREKFHAGISYKRYRRIYNKNPSAGAPLTVIDLIMKGEEKLL